MSDLSKSVELWITSQDHVIKNILERLLKIEEKLAIGMFEPK